jgi:thioesterase domain-containing protein
MTDLTTLCRELETLWRGEIPVTATMDVRVAAYDGTMLTVRAPHEPNRNPHGTAFAGSLYSLCVLTGWGSVWLALRRRGLRAHIVAAESRIQYRRAVADEIVCVCSATPSSFDAPLADVAMGRKARLELTCTVDADGKHAVTFTGTYAVHPIEDGGRAPH